MASISIHAPAGGATKPQLMTVAELYISIHAPAGGATSEIRNHKQRYRRFQFTPLREGRLGARLSSYNRDLFQFTPLREGRPAGRVEHSQSLQFQFTPLREGRLRSAAPTSTVSYFNSRPCGRGDWVSAAAKPVPTVFQFTPLREGRLFRSGVCQSNDLFQFTPLREGRRPSLSMRIPPTYFNSRPCGRGDAQPSQRTAPKQISIHAPAGGATCRSVAGLFFEVFQFTPLREGRHRLEV